MLYVFGDILDCALDNQKIFRANYPQLCTLFKWILGIFQMFILVKMTITKNLNLDCSRFLGLQGV